MKKLVNIYLVLSSILFLVFAIEVITSTIVLGLDGKVPYFLNIIFLGISGNAIIAMIVYMFKTTTKYLN